MDRHFAFLTVLILLLCGCTADDNTTTAVDGSVRFFVQTDAKTRGSVIGGTTLPNIESFRVFAWKTVGGETSVMMTSDATDTESNVVSYTMGAWLPKRRYYWPTDDGATVSYYAVYPSDYTVTKNGGDVAIDITIPVDISSQHDVMAAKNENLSLTATTGGAAQLTFHHLTSQVSFQAKLAPAFTGWQVAVRSIRICNVNSRGTYLYGDGSMTPASPAVMKDYDLVMAAASTAVTSTSESVALTSATDVAMLMPQSLTAWDRTTETASSGAPSTTGCYLAIGCTITDSDGNLAFSGNTYVPLAPEWQKACHYNYLLEFGSGYQGDGDVTVNNIGIVCTISDWVPGNTADVNIEQD